MSQVAALLVDTSPRPNPFARRMAAEMRAHYVPLPYADATALSTRRSSRRGGVSGRLNRDRDGRGWPNRQAPAERRFAESELRRLPQWCL
jgi:hypothetical protein